jgi:hypothetical protein
VSGDNLIETPQAPITQPFPHKFKLKFDYVIEVLPQVLC